MQYQNECPIYRASLKPGTLPLIWQNIWERVGTNAVQRQMRDEAGELGVSQVVSVPFKELSGDRGAIGFRRIYVQQRPAKRSIHICLNYF